MVVVGIGAEIVIGMGDLGQIGINMEEIAHALTEDFPSDEFYVLPSCGLRILVLFQSKFVLVVETKR